MARPPVDPKTFLTTAGRGRTLHAYPKNARVFSQGDPADSIFYIVKGRVKLTVVSRRGKEAVIGILGSDEFFGEGCIAGQPLRMASATSLCDCSATKVNKKEVLNVIKSQPAFTQFFLDHMLARNVRIEEDLVDQLFNSSEKRLARVLLLLANFGNEETIPDLAIPKISQEILAEIVGTTRSRVNFFMNRFRKLGFIEYNGELKIHRSLLSVILHD
jgi:CRP/FNR family cyclic AMP-dependent transcriptional regulator